jgi:hypothetical protein
MARLTTDASVIFGAATTLNFFTKPNTLQFYGASMLAFTKPNNLNFFGASALPAPDSVLTYQIF